MEWEKKKKKVNEKKNESAKEKAKSQQGFVGPFEKSKSNERKRETDFQKHFILKHKYNYT